MKEINNVFIQSGRKTQCAVKRKKKKACTIALKRIYKNRYTKGPPYSKIHNDLILPGLIR